MNVGEGGAMNPTYVDVTAHHKRVWVITLALVTVDLLFLLAVS